MFEAREKWVDELLGRLSPEQKIGQLLVFGFCSPVITPDVVELIRKYHVGGLRVSQKFRCINLFNDVKPGTEPEAWVMRSLHYPEGLNRDFSTMQPSPHCTAEQYAGVLNRLRDHAMDRPGAVPLHFTIDQEGSASDDLLCGQRLFPHPMGLAASGDPALSFRVAYSIGQQARAMGVNMIHSPVLDVNTDPRNPEIGTRAYGDNAEDVTRHGLETLRGFQQSGLVATGKHFPGRGESAADAHWGLPTVEVDRKRMDEVHLAPYRALIDAGLPAIMMAHCLYPSLGVTEEPASCTRSLVTDFIRGELGFEGVITTDNMMMGGLLQRYELTEAVLRTLQAGCDLVLLRDESPIRIRICEKLLEALRNGRLSEKEVDEKVRRILRMRWDMGLAEDGGKVDPDSAGEPTGSSAVVRTADEAAEKSLLLLRDNPGALPVDTADKVLLVEQVFPTHSESNNMYSHPGMLWEQMSRLGEYVGSVEVPMTCDAEQRQRVLRRLDEDWDVIVATNYYYHKTPGAITELVRELIGTGKPVIVVTNTPYAFGAAEDFPSVLVCFNPGSKECLRATADAIFGRLKPHGQLQVRL
ncbi:MAG: glycoside hydrolase family 3 N-terminal domain-containing protein [Phycisphaerae bacterium]